MARHSEPGRRSDGMRATPRPPPLLGALAAILATALAASPAAHHQVRNTPGASGASPRELKFTCSRKVFLSGIHRMQATQFSPLRGMAPVSRSTVCAADGALVRPRREPSDATPFPYGLIHWISLVYCLFLRVPARRVQSFFDFFKYVKSLSYVFYISFHSKTIASMM